MQALKVVRPTTIQEAIGHLNDGGPGARPLAGGTDVIVIARARVRDIDVLVDVKQIPELTAIEWDPATGLTIGAATPCYELYGNADVVANYPAIIDSATLIGGTGIQGRASFGGNLCNSSPSGDTIPTQIVLEGVANIIGPNGERSVPVEDFCTGPGRNVLEQGEFLVSISFPAPDPNGGARFLRFIPRNEMDIAVCNAASAVKLDGDTVRWARVSIGAVAPTPLLVQGAADALEGNPLTDETIEAAAAASRDAATPIDDMRGSIKQRKHLSAVLTKRTLQQAAARARGEDIPSVGGH
ncbi:MAG: xanthine dehydrogenase family protein subunit M [Chloroflexi bacterium]|nr:xanthine dehydrogenase family protein subunit M [Chloroflexota bacterium]